VAAKQAEREAKKAEKRRREKRKSWLLLIGIVLLMIAAILADWLFIKSKARQHHEKHHEAQGKPKS
jgi:flagellar basal body-associated protein FliL